MSCTMGRTCMDTKLLRGIMEYTQARSTHQKKKKKTHSILQCFVTMLREKNYVIDPLYE